MTLPYGCGAVNRNLPFPKYNGNPASGMEAGCVGVVLFRGQGQNGFKQVAVYAEAQGAVLQLHEVPGDVQAQTAALRVPGPVSPPEWL